MTNEEYQRQAAERSRQADEARRRQSLEDFNRHERERAARNAQVQKENYSRSLGSRGLTPPPLGPGVDRAAYNRARQAYDANQRSLAQFNQGFSSGGASSYSGSSGGFAGGSGKAKSAGAGLVVLLIVIAVIAYSGSGGSSTNSQNTDNSSSSSASPSDSGAGQSSPEIAKPSPSNQDATQNQYQSLQAQPAQQSYSQSATTTAPGSDGTATQSAPADADAPAAPPPPVSITRMANRDGMNNGCKHGQLTIDPSTITFTCPSDASKSVTVTSAQVIDLDNNGILVYPKQKYHFDIDGMQKQEVHDLFAQWLQNARNAAAPSSN